MEEEKEELTLQNGPKAVNYLINEIAEMRAVLEHVENQLGLESTNTVPSALRMPAAY